jgi:hypothetical protein
MPRRSLDVGRSGIGMDRFAESLRFNLFRGFFRILARPEAFTTLWYRVRFAVRGRNSWSNWNNA